MKKISFAFVILFLSLSLFSCANNEIIISFKTNGGSILNDITYRMGTEIRLPDYPNKEGYTFDGWYMDPEFNHEFDVSLLSEDDAILYAKWEKSKYQIVFNTDGGSPIAPIVQEWDTVIEMPDDPVKEGHFFLGWDKEIPEIMPIGGLELKALWSLNLYTVSFDSDGGTEITSIKGFFGSIINNLEIPAKEGYNFLGWGVEEPFEIPAMDITLKALWEIKTFDFKVMILKPMSDKVDFIKSSTGTGHTLAITEQNEVYAWGTNWAGQVGDKTNDFKSTPINITPYFLLESDESIVDIFAGYLFSMALSSKGRVFTWGYNDEYRLGRDYGPYNEPVDITQLLNLSENEKVNNIATGYAYAIATTNLGRIFTWGQGQHPDAFFSVKNQPTDMSIWFNLNQGEYVQKVTSSYTHSMIVTSHNRVFTWGFNSNGQLGNGTFSAFSSPIDITSSFQLQQNEYFVDISSENYSSLAVTNLGKVYVWGMGFSSSPQNITDRFELSSIEMIISVCGSDSNPLFLSSENRLYTLGDSGVSELNSRFNSNSYYATDITNDLSLLPSETIIDMSRNYDNINLITSTGRLLIFGNNDSGQVGNGFQISQGTPVNIANLLNLNVDEDIMLLSSRINHTLLITTDGNLITWGDNNAGKLGISPEIYNSPPINIASTINLVEYEEILQISTAFQHNVVLTTFGRVFAWGQNYSGGIGNGTQIDSHVPIDVTSKFDLSADDKIVRISTGSAVNLAVSNKGQLFIWGIDYRSFDSQITYQIPENITSNFSLEPNEIIKDVIAGQHFFIITSEDRIFAWGNNNYGQIGNGTNINANQPIDITQYFGLEEEEYIISLKISNHNTLALSNEGRIFSCGESMLLGNNSFQNSNQFIDITSRFNLKPEETIKGIEMKFDFAIAYTTENRVFVWGLNSYDVLSYLITSVRTPSEITNLFNFDPSESIKFVEAGDSFWFLVTTKNNIYALGLNSELRLGIVSSYFLNEPQYWDEMLIDNVKYGEEIPYPKYDRNIIAWFLDSEYKRIFIDNTMRQELILYPLFG